MWIKHTYLMQHVPTRKKHIVLSIRFTHLPFLLLFFLFNFCLFVCFRARIYHNVEMRCLLCLSVRLADAVFLSRIFLPLSPSPVQYLSVPLSLHPSLSFPLYLPPSLSLNSLPLSHTLYVPSSSNTLSQTGHITF